MPRYLFVVTVPRDADKYADLFTKGMLLRNIGYFLSLHDREPLATPDRSRRIRVKIPVVNVLTVAALRLPTRDDLGDNLARIRDVLRTLSAVELRPVADIARDIALTEVDTAAYRLFPVGQPAGFTSLPNGLQAVIGLRDLVGAAARAVDEGPHFRFTGRRSPAVGDLLNRVHVGSGRSYGVGFTLLVPHAAAADLSGHDVMTQMYDATSAVEEATRAGEVEAFDETVSAGVSADLCAALSNLAGHRRREPFEIGFRWARRASSDLPAHTVPFPRTPTFSSARRRRDCSGWTRQGPRPSWVGWRACTTMRAVRTAGGYAFGGTFAPAGRSPPAEPCGCGSTGSPPATARSRRIAAGCASGWTACSRAGTGAWS